MPPPVGAARRPCALALAATLATLAAAMVSCGGPPPPPRPGSVTPVIFISLDTFRADGLGALRRRRPSISPALDALRRDSVLFSSTVVPMAFTLPSHMSMFTGLSPEVHRVAGERARLAEGVPTLPQLFHQAGYHTVGWMTNEWLKADFGFGRGFDSYERIDHDLTYADRVVAHALGTLDEAQKSGRPLFLFLHFMDAHSDFYWSGRNVLPYYSPEEFRAGILAPDDQRHFCDDKGRCATDFLEAADREHRTVAPEDLALMHRLYEAGLRYLDRDLGNFFAELKKRGLYDRALIVLTSDHGEEIREHGMFLHEQVYAESIDVPLLIKLPGNRLAGATVRDLTTVTDLFPTLAELAGLTPPPNLQGRSLVPLIEGTEKRGDGPARALVAEDKLVRSRYALRTPSHALVYDLATQATELYDLRHDPDETTDVAASDPKLVDHLRRRLLRALREDRKRADELGSQPDYGSLLTKEERDNLKSLGYL
jgi:arylsulfatase A-like enzyme